MAAVDLRAVIALPPADIYAVIADLARRPSLDPTITELAPPDGDTVVGARFSGRSVVTGSNSGFDGIVTAAEPSQIFGMGLTTFDGAKLVEEIRLSPVPSGTLLAYHAELRLPGGLLGKLLDRVMVGSGFRKQREVVLAHLKAGLERDIGEQQRGAAEWPPL
jgi:hypothetical protein